LLYYELSAKNSNLKLDSYQLSDTLVSNPQRHRVMVARDKDTPNEAYLIDGTVKQFDSGYRH